MAYQLAGEYLWSKDPDQYAHIYYDHRRVGADMQYRYKIVIDGVSAPWYMGYPIKINISINGSSDGDITLKDSSTTRFSDITYERPGWKTVSSKTSGTTPLAVKVFTGFNTSDEDASVHTYNMTVDPAASVSSTSNGTLGTAQTIKVTKYNSSFTHTIVATCGTDSQTIVTKGSSTSISWTPKADFAKQNTTGSSLTAKITTSTYSGSTLIGTTEISVSLTIPKYKPSVSVNVSAVNPTTFPAALVGEYIQNISKVMVSATPTLAYSSPIDKYYVNVGTFFSSYAKVSTSTVIPKSGNIVVSVYAVDKRGNQSDVTQTTISATAYSSPKFSSVKAYRTNAALEKNPIGTTLVGFLKASATEILVDGENVNSATFSMQYKEADGTWNDIQPTEFGTGASVDTQFVLSSSISIYKAYDVRGIIEDGFQKVFSDTIVVSFGQLPIDLYPSATGGLALNKLATVEGSFDVDFDAIFRKNLSIVVNGAITSIFKTYFRVGDLLITTSSANPKDYYGGEWEQIKDCFLLACGDKHAAGETGGEETHKLTLNEAPVHEGHLATNVKNEGGEVGKYLKSSVLSDYGTIGRGWMYQSGSEAMPQGHSKGGGEAHNNMPPYLAVYVWKRIA